MSDAQDKTPKFTNMMVTPDVSGAETPEEFNEAYYKANPWAKPGPSEDKPADE